MAKRFLVDPQSICGSNYSAAETAPANADALIVDDMALQFKSEADFSKGECHLPPRINIETVENFTTEARRKKRRKRESQKAGRRVRGRGSEEGREDKRKGRRGERERGRK